MHALYFQHTKDKRHTLLYAWYCISIPYIKRYYYIQETSIDTT